MNINKAPTQGMIWYPSTTAEVFANWMNRYAHSTMERVFGSVDQCMKECCEMGIATVEGVCTLTGFRAFCQKDGNMNAPARHALAARIAEEINTLRELEESDPGWYLKSSSEEGLAAA